MAEGVTATPGRLPTLLHWPGERYGSRIPERSRLSSFPIPPNVLGTHGPEDFFAWSIAKSRYISRFSESLFAHASVPRRLH